MADRLHKVFSKRHETWQVDGKPVRKIAVRDQHGQFHGATNFVVQARRRKA